MPETPTGTDVRAYEALALFARLLETSVNRALQREFGITWEEYAVLSLLHRSPHQFLHMTEAATALGFSRSRVTRAVTRQEIHARVIRSACPRDARDPRDGHRAGLGPPLQDGRHLSGGRTPKSYQIQYRRGAHGRSGETARTALRPALPAPVAAHLRQERAHHRCAFIDFSALIHVRSVLSEGYTCRTGICFVVPQYPVRRGRR
ncbi:MarR family winged helix-turn-helix transcriptional regulator [Streptomyces griseorubiginosus]|uniref:MarR family winged helix-turn-helix transcriptional regulator n=1 Tax=Streptomyces griseorubiginosus TaxID=67304 RepID=UPI003667FE9E